MGTHDDDYDYDDGDDYDYDDGDDDGDDYDYDDGVDDGDDYDYDDGDDDGDDHDYDDGDGYDDDGNDVIDLECLCFASPLQCFLDSTTSISHEMWPYRFTVEVCACSCVLNMLIDPPKLHLFLRLQPKMIWIQGPSLKLTANTPENGRLEYDPFLLERPIFRGELLVSGRVYSPESYRRKEPENSSQQEKEKHLRTIFNPFFGFQLTGVIWMFPKIEVPQNGWFIS